MAGEPGLGQDCCEWLHDREVAAVVLRQLGHRGAARARTPNAVFNVHMVLIRDMGMTLGEILDFEELAADCAADGVWEFFFCAPPLKVTKGVGSPINPLAIKYGITSRPWTTAGSSMARRARGSACTAEPTPARCCPTRPAPWGGRSCGCPGSWRGGPTAT